VSLKLDDVADAVVGEIGGIGGLTTPLDSVERAYLHEPDQASDKFRCFVVAVGKASEKLTRGGAKKRDIQVIAIFSKRVTAATNDLIDPLMETVETVFDFYDDWHAPGGVASAQVTKVEMASGVVDAAYDVNQIHTESVFWSELVITLSVWE
jgi:hypothetical protein